MDETVTTLSRSPNRRRQPVILVASRLSWVAAPCTGPLLLGFFVISSFPAQAEGAWRSVGGADLHALFVDHELADGVHYAYQFRGDGTFGGFSMGKAISVTWRVEGNEFCWTQKRRRIAEECFDVERSGSTVRLLRDGVEAVSAKLVPARLQPDKEPPR